MAQFVDRIRHAFNAFVAEEQQLTPRPSRSYSYRTSRHSSTTTNERSIIQAVNTRLAMDAASVAIKHIRTDMDGRYASDMVSGLNECLSVQANVDQGGRSFRQDIIATMLEEGVAAIVPVETSDNMLQTASYEILSMRVGTVKEWFPRHVRVEIYDDRPDKGGQRRELILPKERVAIVDNPLYQVMNQPNSTVQRLIRKLQLLDRIDEENSAGRLDLIIQLPYVVKSDLRKAQAEARLADIQSQLKTGTHGIAYTDGTEKITQLNRPAENKLLEEIESLTKLLYSQLGLTENVMNGTASETEMLNYMSRTIEPILTSIVEAMRRTFLTKTARSQGQTVIYYRKPFDLMPVSQIADVADKLVRNEVLTSNELRQILGYKPSSDPKADQLVNSNMPQEPNSTAAQTNETDPLVEPDPQPTQ